MICHCPFCDKDYENFMGEDFGVCLEYECSREWAKLQQMNEELNALKD